MGTNTRINVVEFRKTARAFDDEPTRPISCMPQLMNDLLDAFSGEDATPVVTMRQVDDPK